MSRLVFRLTLAALMTGAAVMVTALMAGLPGWLLFSGRFLLVAGGLGVAGVWLGRRALGANRCDTVLVNLSILAAVLLLFAGVAEIVVRALFRDVTTTNDNRSVFSRKWKESLRLNAAGFRDREPGKARPEVFRLAVIGDSFTFGQGIAAGERFTHLVEAALNRDGATHEVLNFGIPGSETVDHIETLQDVVLPLTPDFVLLQWYSNDVEGRLRDARPRAYRLIPSDFLGTWLHEHSALYYLVNRQWRSLQRVLGLAESYDDYMREHFEDPESPDWQTAAADLARFISLCQEAGVRVGIVLFPVLDSANPFAFLHQRVMRICAEQEIACLDLEPVYAAHEDKPSLWANRLDSHPGSRANEMAAAALLERFGPAWLSAAQRPATDSP